MSTDAESIDHATFERLVAAGVVRGADVVGHPGGWGIVVKYGKKTHPLAARRGAARTFRKFETLVTYLKGMGISQYTVNATEFDVDTSKKARSRPDSAERMRRAFEAKAHADWISIKVEKSLSDEQPNVSHLEVMADVQAVIDSKRRKHARKAAA